MRICLDLDGVICELRNAEQSYADVSPIPGAIKRIQAWKESGHYIIINTARHWKTCQGNVGLILARQGAVTLDWLKKHDIPYDEIHFGKPWADIYIDDNALRFNSWKQLSSDADQLPLSSEKKLRGKEW